MNAISNGISSAGALIGYVVKSGQQGLDAVQKKFKEVTDACLPKSIAPIFRDAVTSAPITYAALKLPFTYTLFAITVLTVVAAAKDMGGERWAEFPGRGLSKAFNNGLGGAFLLTAGKMAYAFGKTLIKTGTVKDPFIKTGSIIGQALVASFFYSRKDKPIPTAASVSALTANAGKSGVGAA